MADLPDATKRAPSHPVGGATIPKLALQLHTVPAQTQPTHFRLAKFNPLCQSEGNACTSAEQQIGG